MESLSISAAPLYNIIILLSCPQCCTVAFGLRLAVCAARSTTHRDLNAEDRLGWVGRTCFGHLSNVYVVIIIMIYLIILCFRKIPSSIIYPHPHSHGTLLSLAAGAAPRGEALWDVRSKSVRKPKKFDSQNVWMSPQFWFKRLKYKSLIHIFKVIKSKFDIKILN